MPAPETLGPRVARHLLNRAGYGPRPGEATALVRRGLTTWIDEQLEPGADPELEARLAAYPTLGYPISRILDLYNADQRSTTVVLDEFASALEQGPVPAELCQAFAAHRIALYRMVVFEVLQAHAPSGLLDRGDNPLSDRAAVEPLRATRRDRLQGLCEVVERNMVARPRRGVIRSQVNSRRRRMAGQSRGGKGKRVRKAVVDR